jgi:hypothetical protein
MLWKRAGLENEMDGELLSLLIGGDQAGKLVFLVE